MLDLSDFIQIIPSRKLQNNNNNNNNKCEVLTSVKIQAEFQVLKPCSVMVGYRRFGCPCCLHHHFTLRMEARRMSETSVSYHNSTWSHKAEDLDLNP